tara:strand:+ start:291 stop:875 length:585 start_codon:yes stop_codon:yes gene_type:complete
MELTKTQQYLFPALYFGYDYDFKLFLRDLSGYKGKPKVRVNSYLGDINYTKGTDNCIFILLKVGEGFNLVLDTFKEHKSYRDDYEVGDFDSDYHMVVCKLENTRAFNYFVLSRYSKMYSDSVLEANFLLSEDAKTNKRKYVKAYHVFKKTEERKIEIAHKFNMGKDFVQTEELPEYEGVINIFDEMFDYAKIEK